MSTISELSSSCLLAPSLLNIFIPKAVFLDKQMLENLALDRVLYIHKWNLQWVCLFWYV